MSSIWNEWSERRQPAINRKTITAALSAALEKHIDPHNDPRIYWAKEVTFDYASGHSVRVDYMRFKPANNSVSGIEKGDFYCYEIKSSVEDFASPNGHNYLGDYNYYVMPEDVYAAVKDKLPFFVGVLIPDGTILGGLKSVRNARRKDRDKPLAEMLLMMWRSDRRELVKIRSQQKNKKETDSEEALLFE